MSKLPDYRLRIVRPQPPHQPTNTYVVRKAGRVEYISASETPLALSNLIMDDAAAMRFELEDALCGADAAKVLRVVLEAQWQNNKPLCPKVEVLP